MFKIANKNLKSRLFLGTASYPSFEIMKESIRASRTNVITVSIRRQIHQQKGEQTFWKMIQLLNCHLLPNTAGCHDINDAITTAEIARELFETNWIKLEVIGDDYNLQPDPIKTITAAKALVKKGFDVFVYCTDDLVCCQRLRDCGCVAIMPWASPIGSGRGLLNPYALETIRHRIQDVPLIIDAGIGKPSDAILAMELGFDAILLNSAVAMSVDPIRMASAFHQAINAGRIAYEAGTMPSRNTAVASTPLLDTPFWLQE